MTEIKSSSKPYSWETRKPRLNDTQGLSFKDTDWKDIVDGLIFAETKKLSKVLLTHLKDDALLKLVDNDDWDKIEFLLSINFTTKIHDALELARRLDRDSRMIKALKQAASQIVQPTPPPPHPHESRDQRLRKRRREAKEKKNLKRRKTAQEESVSQSNSFAPYPDFETCRFFFIQGNQITSGHNLAVALGRRKKENSAVLFTIDGDDQIFVARVVDGEVVITELPEATDAVPEWFFEQTAVPVHPKALNSNLLLSQQGAQLRDRVSSWFQDLDKNDLKTFLGCYHEYFELSLQPHLVRRFVQALASLSYQYFEWRFYPIANNGSDQQEAQPALDAIFQDGLPCGPAFFTTQTVATWDKPLIRYLEAPGQLFSTFVLCLAPFNHFDSRVDSIQTYSSELLLPVASFYN